MTNKILEDAAGSIQAEAKKQIPTGTWDYKSSDSDTTILDGGYDLSLLAQAVFDSAKILLLPADAMPEVGDEILCFSGRYSDQSIEKVIKVDGILCVKTPFGDFNKRLVNISSVKVIKIIARKGYNAVLQEG